MTTEIKKIKWYTKKKKTKKQKKTHAFGTAELGQNECCLPGWQFPIFQPHPLSVLRRLLPARSSLKEWIKTFWLFPWRSGFLHWVPQSSWHVSCSLMGQQWDESWSSKCSWKEIEILVHWGSWVYNTSPSLNLMIVKKDKRIQMTKFRAMNGPG